METIAARRRTPGLDVLFRRPAMKTLITLLLALATTAAMAFQCPADMKAIDAKLAAGATLADAEMAKLKQLRADGEAAHKAGKHDESVQLLGEAKKLLGM
jgi:hypothetical protein